MNSRKMLSSLAKKNLQCNLMKKHLLVKSTVNFNPNWRPVDDVTRLEIAMFLQSQKGWCILCHGPRECLGVRFQLKEVYVLIQVQDRSSQSPTGHGCDHLWLQHHILYMVFKSNCLFEKREAYDKVQIGSHVWYKHIQNAIKHNAAAVVQTTHLAVNCSDAAQHTATDTSL